MKCSPWTLAERAAKAASRFSPLFLVLSASGQSFHDAQDRLERAKTPEQAQEMLRTMSFPDSDQEFDTALSNFLRKRKPTNSEVDRIEAMIDVRIVAERTPQSGSLKDPRATAQEIKKSPVYHDDQGKQTSNWIGKAYKRVGDLLARLREPSAPKLDAPKVGGVGPWLVTAVWVLLGGAVLVGLYFVLRNFRWVGRRRAKLGGLLAEDEPERTADEWLQRANELELRGEYREAVRCLYLASLVRLDEMDVARFVRHQTNWEHYERIASSPKRPKDLDFLEPTRQFDVIWYGRIVRGPEDVSLFRSVYQHICDSLRLQKTA